MSRMASIEISTTNVPDGRATIEYETFGNPVDPALLLVHGFTMQLIGWAEAFCERLAAAGRYVVVFDNRDVGLSTKLDGQLVDPMAVLTAMLGGGPAPAVPYNLSDMANDAVGLLDALGIDAAHIAGASMGGMIVQTIAIEHPERVLSVTSIMSSTGDPFVGAPTDAARAALLAPPQTEREAYVADADRITVWTSKRYTDVDEIRRRAAAAYDRMFYPEGAFRQLAAIYASGDRSAKLASVACPALVIHGRDDTLITPSGGEATAAAIQGAHLLMLSDMGHDLPEQLYPIVVAAMTAL